MDPINETRTYEPPSGPPVVVDDDFAEWILAGGPTREQTADAVAKAREALRTLRDRSDDAGRAAQPRQQSRDDGDDATRSRTR